jgi:hypothetical protein
MMSDKHPVDAMCYIRDLGLFYVVFAFPEKLDPPVLDTHDWYVFVLIFSCQCVDYMQVPNYFITRLHFQISGLVDFYKSVCTRLFTSITAYTAVQFHLIFSVNSGFVFHISKQRGILHILLAVLCSVVVPIPSRRFVDFQRISC